MGDPVTKSELIMLLVGVLIGVALVPYWYRVHSFIN